MTACHPSKNRLVLWQTAEPPDLMLRSHATLHYPAATKNSGMCCGFKPKLFFLSYYLNRRNASLMLKTETANLIKRILIIL